MARANSHSPVSISIKHVDFRLNICQVRLFIGHNSHRVRYYSLVSVHVRRSLWHTEYLLACDVAFKSCHPQALYYIMTVCVIVISRQCVRVLRADGFLKLCHHFSVGHSIDREERHVITVGAQSPDCFRYYSISAGHVILRRAFRRFK